MTSVLRLNDDLVKAAEAEGHALKRSTPKQIEYWAEIGKTVAHLASQNDVLALMQGLAQVRIEPLAAAPVEPEDVFAEVERLSTAGKLTGTVTRATPIYEASPTHPGMLDCIAADGSRTTGRFREGRFIPTT